MKKRLGFIVVASLAIVAMIGTSAFAAIDTAAAAAVNAGALDLKDTLVSVATTILPYAAAIAVFMLGWRLVRKVVKA